MDHSLVSVSAVSYLNTVPLVWGFLQGQARDRIRLDFCVPTECARRVEEGVADIGIVPVAEIYRNRWEIVPGTGIAGHGAVRTILLVHKCEPSRIRTLAADSGSRTSVALCRILLAERYGSEPRVVSMAPDLETMLAAADAALIIGDAALRIDPASLPFPARDLGQEWLDHTGLPMVFALWAGPADRLRKVGGGMAELFRASLDAGLAGMDQLIASESVRRGFAPGLVRDYLTRRIVYDIGERELAGWERFQQALARHEDLLLSSPVPARF